MSDKLAFLATEPDNDDVAVHESSGNVFADLGFENPEEELLKADLVIMIGQRIRALKLSQTKAASRMGVSQPDVSKILRGRIEGYSLDRLLAFLNRLGVNIDISASIIPGVAETEGRTRLRRLEPA